MKKKSVLQSFVYFNGKKNFLSLVGPDFFENGSTELHENLPAASLEVGEMPKRASAGITVE